MDISQVPELVDRVAYPLMFEGYESRPRVYPMLGEVLGVEDASLYGEKGSTMVGMGRPERVEDGKEIPADDFASGRTWYLKIHKFARRIDLPKRMIDASDAVGRITGIVSQVARSWGETFAEEKEDHVADMFQQGTLTAGNLAYFDGSFPNNDDPNPKVIYDGLPWFDTAHPAVVGGATYSNHNVTNPLSVSTLQAALTQMKVTNAYNDRGERIAIAPDTLLVPAGAMGFQARTILQSSLLPGSANNDANVIAGATRVIEWGALDDAASASAWWLLQAGKGLRIRDSGAPMLEYHYDPLKQVMHVIAHCYFGAAVTNWRYQLANNKAAS